MRHHVSHSLVRRVASLALLVLTAVLLSAVHTAAALPAHASLERNQGHRQQRQQWDRNASASAASFVKTNSGTWHTAQLSVARSDLSAMSLPSQGLALFAGGSGALMVSDVVDIFDANAGTIHTAQLSVARCYLSATSLPSQGLALFAGGTSALLWI